MTDAERLAALRKFHDTWGDTHSDDLDVQALWEDMGVLLGTLPQEVAA
jgi:hypothetical protein